MSHLHFTHTSEQSLLEELALAVFHKKVGEKFPKTCSCGKVYSTEMDYLKRTTRAGTSVDYDELKLMQFLRNCSCHSTMVLEIKYEEFNALELHVFKDDIRLLAEEAQKEFKNRPSSIESYKYKKFFTTALHGQDIREASLDEKFWKRVGLNMFRDIYNDKVRAGRIKTPEELYGSFHSEMI